MAKGRPKKERRKGTFTPESMKSALRAVRAGKSVRSAAKTHNINWVTLTRYVKKNATKDLSSPDISVSSRYDTRRVFSDEVESTLENFILDRSKLGFGLTRETVRQLAYETALQNNLKMPKEWEKNKMAGVEWVRGFMQRHPKLSLRKAEGCSIARAICFNEKVIANFFDKLELALTRNPSFQDGSRLWNMDETGTSTVQQERKVIGQRGMKQIHQIKSQERGTLVTTCCFIGAHGSTMPPVMIFPRKKFVHALLNNAYPGTKGLASKSGWMNKDLFVEVLKHFIQCTSSSKQNPTMLIIDNLESHLSLEAILLARDNGVTLLTLPPHTTHKTQPLDVGLFSPFKAAYDSAINNWMVSNPGRPVSIYEIAGFVNFAWSRCATPSNIIAAFGKTGIFPFNRNVFTEEDFAPSKTTFAELADQPIANPVTKNAAEDVECDSNSSSLEDEDDPAQVLHDLNCNVVSPSVEIPESSAECSKGKDQFISPYDFKGLPKAVPVQSKRKPRRKGRCMIPTDTPEKNEIQRLAEEKDRKTQEKENRKRIREETKKEKEKVAAAKKKLKLNQNAKRGTARKLFPPISPSYSSTSESDEENPPPKIVIEPNQLKPFKGAIGEGDYVLVLFQGKDKKFYVGKIIREEDKEGDLEISYLRSDRNFNFRMPKIPDLKSVHKNDIKLVLPKPACSGTSRQKEILQFEVDFKKLRLG